MVDAQYLEKHYAELVDEELIRLQGSDLVPEARQILAAELERRGYLKAEGTSAVVPVLSEPAKPSRAMPRWSRFLVRYSMFPAVAIFMFGVRGILWIALAIALSRYFASSYSAFVRTTWPNPSVGLVVAVFVLLHIALLFVYVKALRLFAFSFAPLFFGT